ncbi:MAG: hypothetical protein FWE78_02090 [Methanimicrococcus sp.]|nr:hypothetical protein [Methanimicrococcus sp.]
MASSILAAILSFFIPGLGQFYSGHFLRGVLIFIISLLLGAASAGLGAILMITLVVPIVLALIALVFWIWNIIDAWQLASRTTTRY